MAPIDCFVGRDRDLGELVSLLTSDSTRAVTLVGAGGTGKTRLAMEALKASEGLVEEEPIWLDLAGIGEGELIVSTIARALGLSGVGHRPDAEGLAGAIGSRNLLLVWDNCEHLLPTVATLATSLLRSCDGLTLLATSRERLNITGEVVREVGPLTVPEPGADPDRAIRASAVALFADRARLVGGLEVDESNVDAVADICRLVDGLPLGIELAANKTNILGLNQIRDTIADSLHGLSGAYRGSPARHQSLRALLEWSYRLLTPPEQDLLEALSVFRGPFSVEAALEVGRPAEPEHLQHLMEKSLLQSVDSGGGYRHLRFLETIRRFAQLRSMESGGYAVSAAAHASHYANRAHAAAAGIRGPDQETWLRTMSIEEDNYRQALAWLVSACEGDAVSPEDVLVFANDMFWYWNGVDAFAEGRRWVESALDASDRAAPDIVSDVQATAGLLCWLLGDFESAGAWVDRSIRTAEVADDERAVARARSVLGRVLLYRGDVHGAMSLFHSSATAFESIGDRHELGLALTGLGVSQALDGDPEAGLASACRALDVFRDIGDPYFSALALGDVGWLLYLADRSARASEYLSESLELRRTMRAGWLTAQTLNQLAEVMRHRGELANARALLEEGIAIAEDIGSRTWILAGKVDLGLVLAQGGDESAVGQLIGALEDAERADDAAKTARCIEALAIIVHDRGDHDLACSVLAAGLPYRAAAGGPRTPAERREHALAEALPCHPTSADDPARPTLDDAVAAVEAATTREVLGVWVPEDSVTIEALGHVNVYRGRRLLGPADWTYAKPREIILHLLESGPRTKEQIGLAFWPDVSAEQLRRNLRSALYHGRRALGDTDWVLYGDQRYSFNRDKPLRYDVERFEMLHRRGIDESADDDAAISDLEEALGLYRGDLMSGLADDGWVVMRREELRGKAVTVARELGSRLESVGDHLGATRSFRRALSLDPYRVDAHVDLLRALVASGDVGGALAHHDEIVGRYRDDLGVSIPAEIERFVASLGEASGTRRRP